VGLANKTNLIAEFGRDLLAQGYTSIPNLLLRSYKSIGITDQELVVLLHLIYLRSDQKNWYPVTEILNSLMSASSEEIENCLNHLVEKKVLAIDQQVDPENLEFILVYNLEGLFNKMSEVWALEKNGEYEEQQKLLQARQERDRKLNDTRNQGMISKPAINSISETASKVYRTFENEFGRPLSPIEGELIFSWCDQFPVELVLEALRLSVIHGTFNLRYIERILQDWQRKNIRCLREVRQMEEVFLEKRSGVNRTRVKNTRTGSNKIDSAKEEKYRDLYSI
jgi:DNA replication protein